MLIVSDKGGEVKNTDVEGANSDDRAEVGEEC